MDLEQTSGPPKQCVQRETLWVFVPSLNCVENNSQKSNTVFDSVERRLPIQKIGSSIPGRVKPITYTIDTCHFLVRSLALLG